MFLSCGGRTLAMGRFLVQGALAVSIKFMVSGNSEFRQTRQPNSWKKKRRVKFRISIFYYSGSILTIEIYKAVKYVADPSGRAV
jgi:hypothetical protein